MEKKTLQILVVAAVVIGAAALFLLSREQAAWTPQRAAGQKILGDFDPNAVARMVVKTATGTMALAREGETWVVPERGNYPANFTAVSDAIRKLWELKAVQEVRAGPSQFPRLQLVEPADGAKDSGTLVDLIDAGGKRITAIILGKNSFLGQTDEGGAGGYPNGRFVRSATAQGQAYLVAETFSVLEPKPENWILRDFVRPDSLRSISMTGSKLGEEWTVTRENANAEWKLSDPKPDEKPDAAKLSSLPRSLPSLTVYDVTAPGATVPGMDKARTLTVQTFDGFTYTFRLGQADGDKLPVTVTTAADLPTARTPATDEKPENKEALDKAFQENLTRLRAKLDAEKKFEGRTFWLPSYTFQQILRDRADLMAAPA
ncbi:MAG TPA: DUF4340 domain-containing protein, partial [Candidatus Methylacidiphilales bacterium]|nr:DUF4340 domain-containing protein [Candidatus Methylacidiphilales bacterium]